MLGGLDTKGCRGIPLISYSLSGDKLAEVAKCIVEVEYVGDRLDEVEIEYPEGERMNLASFLASIEAINEALGN